VPPTRPQSSKSFVPCRSGQARWELRTGNLTGNLSESLRFFAGFGDFNANSCSNSSVLHLFRTEQRVFRAKQGISEFAVCPASFIVSRSSCITRMVSRSPGEFRQIPSIGGDRRDSVSTAACPRERGRRKEHTLVRRGSASCSGFSLLLIEAYSILSTPDLDTAKRLCADSGAEMRKAPRFFFICTPFLHLEDCAKSVPCIRTMGPLTKAHRLCRRQSVDVGGGSESDPLRKFLPPGGTAHQI